jgi:peptidoglycan-associated lipoprotein
VLDWSTSKTCHIKTQADAQWAYSGPKRGTVFDKKDLSALIASESADQVLKGETNMRIILSAMIAATALASGCATKEYVDTSVATLGTSLTARGDATEGLARDAMARANDAHKLAEGKFVYAATLTDETARFNTSRYDLTPEAQARLTSISDQLIAANKNVYIEIQGHTDNTGSVQVNQNIGMMRAEAVRLFLNQRGVPLNRMSSISYRDTAPVAPNDSAASRAANRRVVLIVMN